jgi:hypothetical protein
MSRKPRKPARVSSVSKLPPDIFPPRFRAPREMRAVSAIRVRRQFSGASNREGQCIVPQIRLSGAWLARIGFKRGARFLVLPDGPNQILLALLDV